MPPVIILSCALYTFIAEHLWLFLTVTVLPVVLAMCRPFGRWSLIAFPLNLDWPQWIIWTENVSQVAFCNFWGYLIRLLLRPLSSLGNNKLQACESSHPWRDHSGSLGLCRHSALQPELVAGWQLASFPGRKCHPSPGAGQASEEAVLCGGCASQCHADTICPGELFLRKLMLRVKQLTVLVLE